MELGRQLFADPDLGVDAADARELQLILVAVGPVQALQQLHRTFLTSRTRRVTASRAEPTATSRCGATCASANRALMVCVAPPNSTPADSSSISKGWRSRSSRVKAATASGT